MIQVLFKESPGDYIVYINNDGFMVGHYTLNYFFNI